MHVVGVSIQQSALHRVELISETKQEAKLLLG